MLAHVPHPVDRAQSWTDCDPDLREYILGSLGAMELEIVGAYVHGSLAMQCFYRAKSDVDVLVVVPGVLTPAERAHAAQTLARRSADRPMPGDLEISVLTVAQAAMTDHPRQYEVHYSAYWTAEILADRVDYSGTGRDPDLAAHLTVTRQRGIALVGPPAAEIFAPVPPDAYLDAITADLDELLEGDALLASPYYGVLNACRVLAVIADGSVLSKEEGAHWARDVLPAEHLPIVDQALLCYRSARPVSTEERATDGHSWDRAALLSFREYLKQRMTA
jgi:hypothetical protein